MLNKLLAAAAMAAIAYAVVPASAAKMAGCSGENLAKTETMIDAMADGEGKISAQKEVVAQAAIEVFDQGTAAVGFIHCMDNSSQNRMKLPRELPIQLITARPVGQ